MYSQFIFKTSKGYIVAHDEKELAKELAKELMPMIKDTKKEWVAEACKEIIPKVIEETFLKLGIDSKNPIDMQKDFSHLRSIRIEREDVKKKITNEVLRLTIHGAMAYVVFLWATAKDVIDKH